MTASASASGSNPPTSLGLLVGEVTTGLLQHSVALDDADTARLLTLDPRGGVRTSSRPRRWAQSGELVEGVDCPVATASRSRAAGVGTVASRVTVTGGRVVQANSYTRLNRAEFDYRLPWSHYAARPATLEVSGKTDLEDLAAGFLDQDPTEALDVGSIASRILDTVQRSVDLDRRPPLRVRRIRFRFVISHVAPTEPSTSEYSTLNGDRSRHGERVDFVVVDESKRTLRISTSSQDLVPFVGLCEDLALHDWLLTTIVNRVEEARIGAATGGELVSQLRPIIDNLLHLWMPATQTDQPLADVWESIERKPGMSQQWYRLVDRIRDQMTLSVISLMSVGTERGAER
nr:SCO2521 family protein [Micromonospora sp. DSM 115978]